MTAELCPRCGGELEYLNEVDIGVGTERSGLGCPDCHWTPQEAAVEEEIRILVECPECGADQEDRDGFGVVFCKACGYCTHVSRDGDICGLCGKKVTTCKECEGRGWLEGHAGIDRGAECSTCEGAGIIVEEVA